MKFPVLWLSFVNVWVGLGWVIYLSRGPVSYCKLPASGRIRKYKYESWYMTQSSLWVKKNYFTFRFVETRSVWFSRRGLGARRTRVQAQMKINVPKQNKWCIQKRKLRVPDSQKNLSIFFTNVEDCLHSLLSFSPVQSPCSFCVYPSVHLQL